MKFIVALVAAALAAPTPAAAQTLVSSVPIAGAPAGSSARLIRYNTAAHDGRPVVATGMLITPPGRPPRGGWPVVAWTHGAVGVTPECAVSDAKTRFTQIARFDAMLARGWMVDAPDYVGLGSPGPHPFLVADATARAVIDSVRAARERGGGAAFALWGLSQGGHAALVTGEAARRLAPELTPVGVAAAAPPTDLAANFAAKGDRTARGVLTAFVGKSWSEVYGAPLSTLANRATVRLIERMATVCAMGGGPKIGTVLGALSLGRRLRDVDVAGTAPWGALLRDNSATPGAVGAPLFVTQGSADTIVSAPGTAAYVRAACRAGARLRYVPVAGGDHAGAAEAAGPETVRWLADRFAGKRPPSDCGRI